MKLLALGGSIALALASSAFATSYSDPVGDVGASFTGFPHLDIRSVTVTNDATNLNITFVVNANIASVGGTDWGKYCVLFDTGAGGLNYPANPWGRKINAPAGVGVDYWLGSWVDGGGGAQLWKNNGTAWDGSEFAATYFSPPNQLTQSLAQAALGRVSFTIPLALLGIVADGRTIYFDAITTGGTGGVDGSGNPTGDPGVDHLSLGTAATPDWAVGSTCGDFLPYVVVPAPGSVAILGLGGLLASRRRRA